MMGWVVSRDTACNQLFFTAKQLHLLMCHYIHTEKNRGLNQPSDCYLIFTIQESFGTLLD